ncbi:hypothetical protein Tco_1211633 [Tanacetum coccineum]
MMALTEFEEDDWSMEIDAEHVHFGQDGLGDFDWSNKADDTPVSLALMATNSEVPYCSKCSKSYKQLLETTPERAIFKKAGFGVESSGSNESDKSSGNTNSTESLYPKTFKRQKDSMQYLSSGNSRYPHQKRSFIPSAVLTREGLKSTARPKMTQTVPSKSTANVFYQGTARPRVPQAVLSQSTGRPYYPRMDNVRPRTSSFSPSTRSSTTRTPNRPQRPKKIMKSIWVKKESTVGSQAVLPQNVSVKGSAMINPTQTWRPKGDYLDSVNRDNGSYTLKQFEAIQKKNISTIMLNDSGSLGTLEKSAMWRSLSSISYLFLKFVIKANVLFHGKGLSYLISKFKQTKDEASYGTEIGHENFKNINQFVFWKSG